jgi:hypothetical protein
MAWDTKSSYPPDATRKVIVQATTAQRGAWETAARQMGKASPGAFLAWAGDLYLALQRAYLDTAREHDEAVNPAGLAGRKAEP